MLEESVIRFEEQTVLKLRSLYGRHGYLPYKMRKFEEYELYARNKDFLVSDRVITFNDTDGKLMALKPDVTLSVIRGGEDVPGVKQKLCYNENVYRVSDSTRRFREIMQTGLECIGDVDLFDICEVICLAAESLSEISNRFCLEISNMDVVSDVVSGVCADPAFMEQALACVARKNPHDLKELCDACGAGEEGYRRISALISLGGDRAAVLAGLREFYDGAGLEKMETLSALLDSSPFGGSIGFDFSALSDRNYYNGFVFRGYIDGVFCDVLSGGQYDNLMRRMNRSAGAIGFALYLDKLDGLNREYGKYDVDVLLLYGAQTPPAAVREEAERLIASGLSVTAQKRIPEKLRYREIIDMRKGREQNA